MHHLSEHECENLGENIYFLTCYYFVIKHNNCLLFTINITVVSIMWYLTWFGCVAEVQFPRHILGWRTSIYPFQIALLCSISALCLPFPSLITSYDSVTLNSICGIKAMCHRAHYTRKHSSVCSGLWGCFCLLNSQIPVFGLACGYIVYWIVRPGRWVQNVCL